jgi:hypothetical protein
MKIYIVSCDKRVSYALKMKELLKSSPYEYFFVYGKGCTKKVEPYIEVDVQDAYENLAEKSFRLVEHFLKNFSDEKIVKSDDDNFLDVEKLKLYETAPEDYIGHFHNYEMHDWYDQYFHWYKMQNPEYKVAKRTFKLDFAEGAMYILSRKACEKILKDGVGVFKNTPESYLGEDVRIAMSLNDDSIVKKDIKEDTQLNYEITKDFMSVHPVHLLIFDKLMSAKTNEGKAEVLKKYDFMNVNTHRAEFFKKLKPLVS